MVLVFFLPPIILGICGFLLAIALIYLFLIMPRVNDRADMDMLRTNYAHRGLWSTAVPENSLRAFALASKNGFGIELDIQLSRDKQIMVFHDKDLKRMCGIDKKLSELTCRDLKTLSLAGTDQTIPTLSEVLYLIDGSVPLLIEIKSDAGDTEICKRLASMLDKYQGAFCVESFDPRLLAWFKKYRPRYARGQLVTKMKKAQSAKETFGSFCLSRLMGNVISRPDFIAVEGRMQNSIMIRACHKLFKAPIFVWTVRSPRDMSRCIENRYNFIFEKIRPN